MEIDTTGPERHTPENIVVAPPITELLHDPTQAAAMWPHHANNPLLTEQIEARALQRSHVHEAIAQLPNPVISLELALERGEIDETQVSILYDSLSNILGDKDYTRLVLYLPFEWIPRADWTPKNSALSQANERFKDSYLQAWQGLLSIQDVRANFVDGDVLEIDHRQGDLPRVVKAAHLLPVLLDRGLVSEADAEWLIAHNENPVLLQSLAESLAAYRGLNYVTDTQPQDSPHGNTERRDWWLAQQAREIALKAKAQQVAAIIMTDQALPNTHNQAVLAEGIYIAIEQTAGTDRAQAQELYGQMASQLEALTGFEDTQDHRNAIYRRLHHLKLINKTALQAHGVTLPQLAGPWSENLSLLPEAVADIQQLAASIASQPALQQVYPAILLGGSQIKGYGEQRSDIDVSVFIKPGTPETDRLHIRERLQAALGSTALYEIAEFWLEQSADGSLGIKDSAEPHVSDSSSVHMLFGGPWVGDQAAITELRQGVIPGYFKSQDERKRKQLLERLEQDTLQYRLLHHGYARQYPQAPKPTYLAHQAIDGSSTFWDSGYRQLATKLYINNVFLPKLTDF